MGRRCRPRERSERVASAKAIRSFALRLRLIGWVAGVAAPARTAKVRAMRMAGLVIYPYLSSVSPNAAVPICDTEQQTQRPADI